MAEITQKKPNAFDDEVFAKEANAAINFVFNIFSSIVGNIASNLAPLTAGVLPAYLTFRHIKFTLLYDDWVAWAGAITVEFLGLGSGNELMKIWFHNKHIAKVPEEKLPMLNAGLSATWYILIMVIFNVILEAAPESVFWRITAIALFATLALPGYMLVSGRTLRIQMEQNAERIELEQAEEYRIAEERRIEQERYAFDHAQNSAQELARQQAENERLQKAAELDAQLKIQEMKHRQKMEKIALELRLAEERTANELRTNERTNERTTNERENGFVRNERTTNDSMREIFEIMDRMYATSGRTPSQADVCRQLAIARDGGPDGYERFKSYVNKIWRQWTPPQNNEDEVKENPDGT